MVYLRFPLSLRNVEDLLHERGVDICHETVRFWWNRFGPMFAAEIRRNRVSRKRAYSNWQWHLDEVSLKINGETHYLWRAVDHEGEVLETYVTKRRDRRAALKFIRKSMKRNGRPHILVTDKLRSDGAALKDIGNVYKQEAGRWLNNRGGRTHISHSDDGNGRCSSSGGYEVFRCSPPSTPPSPTTSTPTAAYTPAPTSS